MKTITKSVLFACSIIALASACSSSKNAEETKTSSTTMGTDSMTKMATDSSSTMSTTGSASMSTTPDSTTK